jgi:hypothetical protein
LPELGTVPLLQFVEPVIDEDPAASLFFKKTFAAFAGKASKAVNVRIIGKIRGSLTLERKCNPGRRAATLWTGNFIFIHFSFCILILVERLAPTRAGWKTMPAQLASGLRPRGQT